MRGATLLAARSGRSRTPEAAPDAPSSGAVEGTVGSLVGDVLFTTVAFVAAVLVMMGSSDGPVAGTGVVGGTLLLVAALPLLVRTRWPFVVLVAVTVVTTVYLVLGFPGGAELPLMMAALYTALAEGRRWPALALVGATTAWGAVYRLVVQSDDPVLVAVTVVLLVLVALLGDGAHTRRRLRAEVRERLRVLEVEKELEAQTRLTAQRVQVAHELHDVLAHTITTITVQAGAAADGFDDGSEARSALRSVRASAQDAMRQLSATIGVLRSEDAVTERLPSPGVADLGGLARDVRRAGVDVEVETAGTTRELSPAVDLTVYRMVQEALTNVIRHAGTDRAWVHLHYGPTMLTVTVDDRGSSTSGSSVSGGFGLVGMRERVHALGGRLDSGHRSEGGYRVRAMLPLAGASA